MNAKRESRFKISRRSFLKMCLEPEDWLFHKCQFLQRPMRPAIQLL
jgi:hypothetical protein